MSSWLIILTISIVLAVITAGLFALGVLPLLPILFPVIAAFGALIAFLDYLSFLLPEPYGCVRHCVLSLGLRDFFAAVVLVLLALIAIASGVVLATIAGIIFLFFLALAFWFALIAFLEYTRCVAHRSHHDD